MDVLVELPFVLDEKILDQIVLFFVPAHEIHYHVLIVILSDFLRNCFSVLDLNCLFRKNFGGWRKRRYGLLDC